MIHLHQSASAYIEYIHANIIYHTYLILFKDHRASQSAIIPWVKYGELKLLGLGLFLPRAPGQLPSDTTNTEPGVLKETPSRYSGQSRRIFRVSSSEFLTAATLSSERDLFLAPLSVPQLWARATS